MCVRGTIRSQTIVSRSGGRFCCRNLFVNSICLLSVSKQLNWCGWWRERVARVQHTIRIYTKTWSIPVKSINTEQKKKTTPCVYTYLHFDKRVGPLYWWPQHESFCYKKQSSVSKLSINVRLVCLRKNNFLLIISNVIGFNCVQSVVYKVLFYCFLSFLTNSIEKHMYVDGYLDSWKLSNIVINTTKWTTTTTKFKFQHSGNLSCTLHDFGLIRFILVFLTLRFFLFDRCVRLCC